VNTQEIARLNRVLEVLSPSDMLAWAARRFQGQVTLASSLGAEDQVLFDMAAQVGLFSEPHPVELFTLDIGRLFPETLDLLADSETRYDVRFRVYYPEASQLEAMVADAGVNLFRRGVEERHRCCNVRKVQPLRRALAGKRLWIVGVRSEQTTNRSDIQRITWDASNGLLKLCPLIDWTLADVFAYLERNDVPRNPLHASGFPSIGCAPCTRAVAPGEAERAGRWWWEHESDKECGLHLVDGRLVRKR
jgi:phosphoadenosine phosphosulfate reductase